MSNKERKQIVRKHKSSVKKESLAQQRRDKYCFLGTERKQQLISKSAEKYKTMDRHKKEQLLSRIAEKYRNMDPQAKKQLISKNTERYKNQYKTMEPQEKEELLSKYAEKYRTMDARDKRQLLNNMKQKYDDMEPVSKLQKLTKQKEARKVSASKMHNLENYLTLFNEKIREGPYYVCSVCNRILYRKSVVVLVKSKYNIQHLFTDTNSFDGREYICRTCHLKVSKGNIPCQAAYNNLHLDKMPPELSALEKLEQILIAQRIVFEKIVVMPKGQQRKIKGAICNVPVNCQETCAALPRPP